MDVSMEKITYLTSLYMVIDARYLESNLKTEHLAGSKRTVFHLQNAETNV